MRRQFEVMDHDRNGYVEKQDFDMLFDSLIQVRRWTPQSPGYDHLKSVLSGFWEVVNQMAAE